MLAPGSVQLLKFELIKASETFSSSVTKVTFQQPGSCCDRQLQRWTAGIRNICILPETSGGQPWQGTALAGDLCFLGTAQEMLSSVESSLWHYYCFRSLHIESHVKKKCSVNVGGINLCTRFPNCAPQDVTTEALWEILIF